MVNTDWELCDPGRDGKCLTITRIPRGDGIIYFRHEIVGKLGISQYDWCYVHRNGPILMIAFAETRPHPGYRKVYHNKIPHIFIAGHDILGNYVGKGEKKVTRPKIDNGNIIIDLDKLW